MPHLLETGGLGITLATPFKRRPRSIGVDRCAGGATVNPA